MENEAILQYFERSASIVLDKSSHLVDDYYSVMLLIDSIERIFLNGRKAKVFSDPNCFEIFDTCCLGTDYKGSPSLVQFCKYLKQDEPDVYTRSKCFIGYALKNSLLADFVVDLSRNDNVMEDLFEKSSFLRTPSLISSFIQYLISLEKLNFETVISSAGSVIEHDTDIPVKPQPQYTEEVQTVKSPQLNNDVKVQPVEVNIPKNPPSIKKKRKVKNRIVTLD